MEKDLMRRIEKCFGEQIKTGIEVVAINGLVKGHPDFTFDNYPADCKSVLMDDWLPKENKVSRKIFWQMQGYMFYMKKDKALLIYESRESGKIIEIWLRANQSIQNQIEEKILQIKNILTK